MAIPQLRPGDEVAGHRIVRLLGSGGFGAVYAATDPALERTVALKLVTRADAGFLARFRDEARLLARIASEHVVQIYTLDRLEDDTPCLTMELVADGSLDDAVARGMPAEPGFAAWVVGDVLEGLEAAHREGVVHRDIKEANILVDRHAGVAKLCDFGIARSRRPMPDEAAPTGRFILGTPHYVAPERFTGLRGGSASRSDDPRSDLYAVGVVFYRLLAGRRPFDGTELDPMAIAMRITSEDAPPLGPEIPEGLARVCHRLLARSPDDRFQTARAAAAALRAAIVDEPTALLDEPTPANVSELPTMSVRTAAPSGEASDVADGAVSSESWSPQLSEPSVLSASMPRRHVGLVAATGAMALVGFGLWATRAVWTTPPTDEASTIGAAPPDAALPDAALPDAALPDAALPDATPPASDPERTPHRRSRRNDRQPAAAAPKQTIPKQTAPKQTTSPRRPLSRKPRNAGDDDVFFVLPER